MKAVHMVSGFPLVEAGSWKGLALPALRQVAPRSLAQDCYQEIKRAILDIDLSPGERLSEIQLAQELKTSKTPVREAFARLASEGLVISRAGHQARVAGLESKSIWETYQVRIMLESASVREVADRLSESDLLHLDDLIEKSGSSLDHDDRLGFTNASHEFHLYLIECSNNELLINMVNHLFDRVRRMRTALFLSENQMDHKQSRQGVDDHRRIYDALVRRDGAEAGRLMAADIQTFLDIFETPVVQEALKRLSYHG